MPHIYGLDEVSQRSVAAVSHVAGDIAEKHAADVDKRARFPEESVRALADAGLLGLCVPAAFGGKGLGPRAFVAAAEKLGQACASTAMIFVMHVSASQAIAASTTLHDRDAILTEIAAGRHLSTLALSEKGSRSQFWAPVSRLEPNGDSFVTNAHKSWVTSASRADSYVASAVAPGATSPLDSVLYLARNGSPGLRVAGSFDGLGLRGNDSAPVSIEAFRMDTRDLVTPLGQGLEMMMKVILPWFCLGTAGLANGLCRAATRAVQEHVSGARFEHTGMKLSDLMNLRARLAEMSVQTEQARALLGYTLGEVEHPGETTALFVLQARSASLCAGLAVTDLAMKICGGAAFSRHLPIERFFRDARAGWVMAPTVDHLHDFIGKALLGLPLL